MLTQIFKIDNLMVDGLKPGIMLLEGAPGVGKTTLALQLAYTTQGKAIFHSTEEYIDTLYPRLVCLDYFYKHGSAVNVKYYYDYVTAQGINRLNKSIELTTEHYPKLSFFLLRLSQYIINEHSNTKCVVVGIDAIDWYLREFSEIDDLLMLLKAFNRIHKNVLFILTYGTNKIISNRMVHAPRQSHHSMVDVAVHIHKIDNSFIMMNIHRNRFGDRAKLYPIRLYPEVCFDFHTEPMDKATLIYEIASALETKRISDIKSIADVFLDYKVFMNDNDSVYV